jgi:titin
MDNELSEAIPLSLTGLLHLEVLSLYHNQLSGTLPTGMSNLTALRRLELDHNFLTGPIPAEIGDLSNLTTLTLNDNHFTGSIPSALGDLTSLTMLTLDGNSLDGTIPSQLGSLTTLTTLGLSNNALVGEVPATIVNLVNLNAAPDAESTLFGYNALTPTNSSVITFLNSKDPTWASTQTVAPTNVQGTPVSSTSVYVSWTPIAYQTDTGYYEVLISTTSGGSYNPDAPVCTTTDKTMSECTVTGLTPNVTVYFVVRTVTNGHPGPLHEQQNKLKSAYSSEVSSTPSNLQAPTNLTASPSGTTEVQLNWVDTSTGETNFRVERSLSSSGGFVEIAIVAANATSHIAPETCGTTYYYRVRTYGGGSSFSPYSNVANTFLSCTALPAPTGMTATTVSVNQINVSWTDNATDETGFRVERSYNGTNGWMEIASVSANTTSYQNTGRACTTRYYYRVRAFRSSGNSYSAYSNVANAITLTCVPPNAPTLRDILDADVTATQINISWTDNSGDETAFAIERYVSGATGWTPIGATVADATSYLDTGRTCGKLHYYRARAYRAGDGQYSAYSNIVDGSTSICPPPTAPFGLTLTVPSSNQIDLHWTDASYDETAFKIERLSGGVWVQAGSASPNATSFQDTGRTCNTYYTYRVRAYRFGDNQTSSPSNQATEVTGPCAPPTAPSNLTATAASLTQINLAWNDNSGDETSFRLERSPNGSTGWIEVVQLPTNTKTYNNINLVCGTTYYYRVRAHRYNDGQYSAYTTMVNTSTFACPASVPVLQRPVNGVLTVDNQPTFLWAPVTDATGYQIQIDDASDFVTPLQDTMVTPTTYTASLLRDSVTYFWRVRSQGAGGSYSNWSPVWSFTVDQIRPATPRLSTPATGINIAALRPALTWLAAAGASQYELVVATDASFSNVVLNQPLARTVLTYSPTAAQALQYGTTYYWRVRAGSGTGLWSDWSIARRFTVTIQKSPANAAFVTTNRPVFTWVAAAGATNYDLQWSSTSNFASPQSLYNGRALTATAPSTLSVGQYYWRLCVTLPSTGSPVCMLPWTLTITAVPPVAPVQNEPIVNAFLSTHDPIFRWTALADTLAGSPFQYQIQIDDVNTFASPARDIRQTVTTYTASSLPEGRYYWRVRAINSADTTGAWSPARQVVLDTIAPTGVPVLTAPADRSSTTVRRPAFTWAAVTGATKYRFSLYSGADCTTLVRTMPAQTTLTYTPAVGLELVVGTTYCWKVEAGDNANNWGPASAFNRLVVSATAIVRPVAPTLSSPLNNSFTQAVRPVFSWTGATDMSYQIQIDEVSTFASPESNITGTNVTSATPGADLVQGKYFWRVRAINAQGVAGPWTVAWNVTVDTTAPTVAPLLVSPTDRAVVRTQRPAFTWAAAAGATRYRFTLYNADCVTTIRTMPAQTTLTYTPSLTDQLAFDTAYCWKVEPGDNALNWGPASVINRVTVSSTAVVLPGRPTQTAPVNNNQTNVTQPVFTWTLANATGLTYHIQVDDTANFSSPVVDVLNIAALTYTPTTPLAPARYNWRVRAINAQSVAGPWSATFVVLVDTTAPLAPVLATPVTGANTPALRPTFTWKASATATQYWLLVDDDPAFGSPLVDFKPTGLTYTIPAANAALTYGTTYYWQVKAKDAAGNWSPASLTNTLISNINRIPGNNASITQRRPAFTWQTMAASTYRLEIYRDAGLTDRVFYKDFTNAAQATYTLIGTGATPDPLLDYGTYYWRMILNGTTPMPAWVLHVTPSLPAKPVQSAPAANALLRDSTPTFQWAGFATTAAGYPFSYQVQIDDLSTFASPNQTGTTEVGALTYTATILPNGTYYWRVRAINTYGAPGAWSLGRAVRIDALVPAVPVMVGPATGTNITNRMLTLTWLAATGANAYEVRLDSTPSFTQPIIPVAAALTYRTPTPLSRGTYYWSVRALDPAGNASDWSPTWSFTVVAGVTVQNDENTPVPTDTVEPTIVAPTTTLMQVVEAETVTTSGTWTAYDSASASGGRYVYSSGSLDDTLTLSFSGTQADVIYIQHPALGSFAIEVDGTVMQTVSATSVEAVFGAKASVTGLAAGAHILRIVPVSGTIAIDAFAVELPVAAPEPTTEVVPTEAATEVPTETLVPVETEIPTEAVPTDVPPTATPLPAPQILDAEVDVIQRAGVWTSYPTDLASGGSYLYSSGSLSDTLTLTFNGTQVDVIYVQHPALGTFALEVDGSVNQIVNAYAAETVFGTRATITVPTGQHTLRILPISGTVALDAFALDAQATVVVPTIEPTVEPTVVPPTDVVPTDVPPTSTPEPTTVPLPVTLPVATSFDSLAGWTAVGAWALDPAGYTGSSVFVSSATRGQENILALDTPLDLRAAFYPHLSFWMRGQTSTADLVSVDISTDGGQSWTLIDLSSRLTAEWTLVDLDLAAFVGQIVSLRFHLDATQPLPDGGASMGYWLDDLTLQEVPPTPTAEPTVEVVPAS